MSKMVSNKKADYSSMEAKWIEFVGVSDEFKMLHDKWDYISSQPGSILPKIDEVFCRMKRVINRTRRLFGRLGFSRAKIENRDDFCRRKNIKRSYS